MAEQPAAPAPCEQGASSAPAPPEQLIRRSAVWKPLCKAEEMQNVKARCFEPLPDFQVALFHIDGQFFALQERCRHQGGPLSQGDIEDLGPAEGGICVRCPWHGLAFSIASGRCHSFPKPYFQESYPTRVHEGEVQVRLTLEEKIDDPF
jgi:3-phenylpropionate/trans-cinnamate dioxygenase ferredoxin subunit